METLMAKQVNMPVNAEIWAFVQWTTICSLNEHWLVA